MPSALFSAWFSVNRGSSLLLKRKLLLYRIISLISVSFGLKINTPLNFAVVSASYGPQYANPPAGRIWLYVSVTFAPRKKTDTRKWPENYSHLWGCWKHQIPQDSTFSTVLCPQCSLQSPNEIPTALGLFSDPIYTKVSLFYALLFRDYLQRKTNAISALLVSNTTFPSRFRALCIHLNTIHCRRARNIFSLIFVLEVNPVPWQVMFQHQQLSFRSLVAMLRKEYRPRTTLFPPHHMCEHLKQQEEVSIPPEYLSE